MLPLSSAVYVLSLSIKNMLKILTARYGPRWACRGLYQRPVSSTRMHLMLQSHYVLNHSLGWRWAFLLQMPVFLLSLLMTGINLRYVTPVRKISIYSDELKFKMPQGKSKSTKEVLKRIDYWGSLTLLLSVSTCKFLWAGRFLMYLRCCPSSFS